MSFPRPFPHAFPRALSESTPSTGEALLFRDLRIGPPWLRRPVGLAFLRAIYSQLDAIAAATASGVKARFPSGLSDSSVLAAVGADRRILRGPGEPPASFATRLRRWLDDHRNRGGAHALLRQLREYHRAAFAGRIDVVAHSGLRYSIVGEAVSRAAVTWAADGSARWAQIWVFFHLPSAPTPLTASDVASWLAVPRDWSAAHILRTVVVLLSPGAELWDYPQPVGQWDDPIDALWDTPADPIQLEVNS